MAELMLSIACEYKDQIQIAFKPHPALLTQLYQHKDWGKQRADAYYQQWKDMENAQLEEGQFIDLFMTSDAMIHDSGSFAVEYHYSKNPVMFVSKDMYPITSVLSDFGKKAYALHYIGSVEADIRSFIEQQVLAGDDPMKAQREEFFQNYLLPPNGKSVAQNVIDDIVESLQL
jgi:CDP-glycerol glycerophosphotransferase (TagB/SpsB family)